MVNLITELINKITQIGEIKHVQIWNNQPDYLEEGESWSFPFPAAFVEINPEEFGQLGSGYQGADLEIKIHLATDFYSSYSSAHDDNLDIFALRDTVVRALKYFKPSEAGPMIKVSENQDFNHSNVYHYVITYKTHYIDTTAANEEITTITPTEWQPEL